MKDFDELLDSVLREDAAAEPRAGLEARVMARVRAEAGHGSALRLGNWWRAWMLGPAAACLGIVAVVWYVAGGGTPQLDHTASRASAPAISVETPGIESSRPVATGDDGLSVGRSGRAKRDAHLSRDETAAKMGHPDVLPKRDVFPSPAPVVASLAPVGVSDAQAAARELRSVEAVEALLDLRRKQAEPVRVAALQIAPLVMDEDRQQVQ